MGTRKGFRSRRWNSGSLNAPPSWRVKSGAGHRILWSGPRCSFHERSYHSHEKKLPEFKGEKEERRFWATVDSTEFVDRVNGRLRKLVRLIPSLKTISLRLPVWMIGDLKILANRRDVPYHSLLKVFLSERLAQERLIRPE